VDEPTWVRTQPRGKMTRTSSGTGRGSGEAAGGRAVGHRRKEGEEVATGCEEEVWATGLDIIYTYILCTQ
jgi:hypothetical protein